jgi:membrane-associated phospholipid phosphatase
VLQILCRGGTFMLAAWPVLRLYNHLTMSTSLPFTDNWLATADTFIGFDWMQYALWLDKYPVLIYFMDYSYTGLTTYSIGLFLLLLFGRNPTERCQELVVLFFSTALICSTVGMFFPAEAAAVHYNAQRELFRSVDPWVGSYHISHLQALRTNPGHVLTLNNLPGLVTFPSFHTAMGIVAIYCARGTPWLFGPSLIVNLLMIGSTPLLGSHYLIDVIAGASIAAGAILALRQFSVGSSRNIGVHPLSPMPR